MLVSTRGHYHLFSAWFRMRDGGALSYKYRFESIKMKAIIIEVVSRRLRDIKMQLVRRRLAPGHPL